MRLFISINFSDEIKDELMNAVAQLRKVSSGGKFSYRDNLHLTLAFIGETDRRRDVGKILDGVECRPFDITLGSPGVFRRDGGDIRWVGIRNNPALSSLAGEIASKLTESGFDIDSREFRPHITLGRQVVCPRDVQIDVKPLTMTADRISLMKSERINGILKYTEIYAKDLR